MPSGHVGAIGVLGVHMDMSERAKAEGIAVTVVSAGKYKAEASEFTPMTADARAHLQHLVDDRYDAFVRAVARGRGAPQKAVREGFGQGRLVTAADARKLGLADSIETIDQVVARLSGTQPRERKPSALAEAVNTRMTLELLERQGERTAAKHAAWERERNPELVLAQLEALEARI